MFAKCAAFIKIYEVRELLSTMQTTEEARISQYSMKEKKLSVVNMRLTGSVRIRTNKYNVGASNPPFFPFPHSPLHRIELTRQYATHLDYSHLI
jgi:tRNA1(Val) A37 N6-methylase TrmN6